MSALKQILVNASNAGKCVGNVDADGFIICEKCGQRKQTDIEILGRVWRMPIACECVEAAKIADQERKARERIEDMKRDYLTDQMYYDFAFNNDDGRCPKISAVCRNYVDNWEQMKEENIGILFYGNTGVGKSFLACCIANGLIEKMVPAMVTSFPTILRNLQGFGEERNRIFAKLKNMPLLVIDDLGVERDTSTALEQVYSVIDSRMLSKKPTIFTTNLDLSAIKSPSNMEYKRIFSRVIEMCPIQLPIKGEDRRLESSEAKAELARQILGVRNGKHS